LRRISLPSIAGSSSSLASGESLTEACGVIGEPGDIAFFAAGRIKKIAASGGPTQNVCNAPNLAGGTWNRADWGDYLAFKWFEMDGGPKPVQRPHPPFLIGGTRERVVRLAAREGDIVGLDLRSEGEAILDAFEARTDVRIGWIRDEAGDRFGRLDINVLRTLGSLAITDQPLKVAAEVARELTAETGVPIDPRDVLESPFSLIGSVPELVDKLRRLRQRWGINSFLVGWFGDAGLRDFAPVVEQLAGT